MTAIMDYDEKNIIDGLVMDNSRLTAEDSETDIREIILKIDSPTFNIKTGQSIGIIAPIDPAFGNKNIMRQYTIAGTDDSDNTVRICVKRCYYLDFINGERYKGTVSNYICDLDVGNTINLVGPYGMPFKVPNNKSADLLMIGLGTGIAPFRALVNHIYDTLSGWDGKVRLFYGAKTGVEMAYMNDEQNDFDLYYDKKTFKAFEAVSPRPHFDTPAALDDALKKNAEEVWAMIQNPETHIFMAGLKVIRDLTDAAFIEMAGSEQAWKDCVQELKEAGRWQEVIY